MFYKKTTREAISRKNQPQKIHKWFELLKIISVGKQVAKLLTLLFWKSFSSPSFPHETYVLLDIVSLAPGRTNKWVSAIEGPKYLLYLKYCLTLDTAVSSSLFLRHFEWNCLKFGKRSPSFIIEIYFSFESCVFFSFLAEMQVDHQ